MRNSIPIGKLSKSYQKVPTITLPDATGKKKLETTVKEPTEDDQDELTQLLANDVNPDKDVFQESYMLTMKQQGFDKTEAANEEEKDTTVDASVFEPFPEMENLNITATVTNNKQPLICIQTFKTEREGVMGLDRIMSEIEPQYVIMYHCNIAAIRQLEVYEARLRRPVAEKIKVYFMIHTQTVKEQSYLTGLRREKQAFELIIDTKSKMVIPEYQDGKTDEAFGLLKHYKHVDEVDNESTRKAGGQQTEAVIEFPKVIVDMR